MTLKHLYVLSQPSTGCTLATCFIVAYACASVYTEYSRACLEGYVLWGTRLPKLIVLVNLG